MNTNVTRPVFKSKNGFSLTELLITVVIIGILAAVVLPKFSKVVAGMKTGEAERLLTAVRQEQEARCTLGKNYTTNTSEIAALPKGTGDNTGYKTGEHFTYQFSASGMSAVNNEEGYVLSIPSYMDGRICCSGEACAGLNKKYPTCDELRQKPNYQVSTQCANPDCEDGQTRNVSAHCGYRTGEVCAGGTWTPLSESIDLTDAEKADCNQCSTPPELSQPCPNGTPAMCTREKTCNTSNGQWEAGEWDCSACKTSSRTPCEEPWTADEKATCQCDVRNEGEKPCGEYYSGNKISKITGCNSTTGKYTYTEDTSACKLNRWGILVTKHMCDQSCTWENQGAWFGDSALQNDIVNLAGTKCQSAGETITISKCDRGDISGGPSSQWHGSPINGGHFVAWPGKLDITLKCIAGGMDLYEAGQEGPGQTLWGQAVSWYADVGLNNCPNDCEVMGICNCQNYDELSPACCVFDSGHNADYFSVCHPYNIPKSDPSIQSFLYSLGGGQSSNNGGNNSGYGYQGGSDPYANTHNSGFSDFVGHAGNDPNAMCTKYDVIVKPGDESTPNKCITCVRCSDIPTMCTGELNC